MLSRRPVPLGQAVPSHLVSSSTSSLPAVVLKAGHVRPVWAGHPWVFAQAIERIDGEVQPGDEVRVLDARGNALGRGLCSPGSAIAVRIFSFDPVVGVDAALFERRLERAVMLRRAAGLPEERPGHETTGYRLVHGEGDGLPGLIVDVYGDVLCVQLGTAGLARRAPELLDLLEKLVGPRAIVDRTPAPVAQSEGFVASAGVVRGAAQSELRFHERGLRYELPLVLGQKTGYYFDQRPLRALVEPLVRGSRVLDACCYVGSFALTAARGGAARVLAVDTSAPAIAAARACAESNGFGDRIELAAEEAASAFARVGAQGGADLVICDPPKLAPGPRRGAGRAAHRSEGRAHERVLDAYRSLGTQAARAVAPGGVLAFSCCAGSVSLEELQRALALGARDAGRRALVVERCFQGADHPVPAAFPEGLYLKTLVARIDVS
ncbi:MAG: class I SAM-dependent rRNA methyltransferase [Deltaproteobacteria bacterium]|nr:class I SAM-dependent rRNA methyltransferase [Deltaproteobacteria bacterium]